MNYTTKMKIIIFLLFSFILFSSCSENWKTKSVKISTENPKITNIKNDWDLVETKTIVIEQKIEFNNENIIEKNEEKMDIFPFTWAEIITE